MTAATAGIRDLHSRKAGGDIERVRQDVDELATLAKAHIASVGLSQALEDFAAAPWVRDANALHFWGVTTSGVHWFDAGHPEMVGLDISGMSDFHGNVFLPIAIASADGTGPKLFELTFPHPVSGETTLSASQCFLLEDGQRVFCAAGFLESQ